MTHRSLSGCPRANSYASSYTKLAENHVKTGKANGSKLDDLTNTLNVDSNSSPNLTNGNLNCQSLEYPSESRWPNGVGSNCSNEEMKTLEEDIYELQEFNEDCENELFQMRADIDRLEQQIRSTKRVSSCSLLLH